MVLSEQLRHMHCGGELSSLAKLAIFVPLSLPPLLKCLLQITEGDLFLIHPPFLFFCGQQRPGKRRERTERLSGAKVAAGGLVLGAASVNTWFLPYN